MTLARYFPLFLGMDDQNAGMRSGRRDVFIARVLAIADGIQLQTSEGELPAEALAHLWAVFSNTAGEDQRIQTAEHRQHRTGFADEPMQVYDESELGAGITVVGGSQNLAQIAGAAGNAK